MTLPDPGERDEATILAELRRLMEDGGAGIAAILRRVIVAKLERATGGELKPLLEALTEKLLVTQRLAAVYGMERTLKEMDRAMRRMSALGLPQPTVRVGSIEAPAGQRLAVSVGRGEIPRVPFDQAIQTVLRREPRLAAGYQEVARVFTQDRAFALARSASLEVTKRVQALTAEALREGYTLEEIARRSAAIAGDAADWTRAYAETVHRTNAASAYSDGRFIQASDPDVRAVIPALKLIGPEDADTRPNHMAAHGIVASPDDPVWMERGGLRPPLGYNCRCGIRFVDWIEARSLGIIGPDGNVIPYAKRATLPVGAHRDEGFVAAA